MLFNTPIQPDNAFCRLNRHRLESTISCYSKPGASSSSPSRGAPAPPLISCPSIATKAHRSQHQERANLSILPPRNQRLEHISALVIPKARTPRQPFYHIPSLNQIIALFFFFRVVIFLLGVICDSFKYLYNIY